MRFAIGLALFAYLSTLSMATTDNTARKRIVESGAVLGATLSAKDKGIPEDLLRKARCVGVGPSLKRAGFIVGAKYGKGVVVCRTASGWSAPSTIRIEGGSFGLQIGAGETDVVFVVMNHHGVED